MIYERTWKAQRAYSNRTRIKTERNCASYRILKSLREHIPTEQGLRPRGSPATSLMPSAQRAYSNRTRIKTNSLCLNAYEMEGSESIFQQNKD